MPRAYIALGSNLGDRRATLDRALELLRAERGVTVGRVSSFHETRPVGGPPDQGPFLNAAAELDTALPPHELLAILRRIEHALGRTRHERWQPRTLDLDILFYADLQLTTPELTLPHPRMPFRRFVLEPLAEIVPDLIHPTLGCTIRALLEHIRRKPHWLAIAGPDPAARTRLARELAARTPATLILAEALPDRPNADAIELADHLRRIYQRAPLDRWLVSDFWLPEPTPATHFSVGESETRDSAGPRETASPSDSRPLPTAVVSLGPFPDARPMVPVLDLTARPLEDQLSEILTAMAGIDD